MKPFEAIPILKSRCAKIKRRFTNLLEDYEVEEIHGFRLQIKKMNAFLHLLNADRPTRSALKIDKGLHGFYKLVGELRNLQLHNEVVVNLCHKLQLPLPDWYLQSLMPRKNEIKNEAREMALQNSVHKNCVRLIAKAPEQVSEKTVENFVSGNKHQLIKIMLANNYTDEILHSIRKLLKDFLYLWSWIQDEILAIPPTLCMNKEACLALTEKLGDYQNLCIAFHFFDTYGSNKYLPSEESSVVAALGLHTAEEKLQLKNKLVTELQSCFQQVWEKDVLLPIYEYQ